MTHLSNTFEAAAQFVATWQSPRLERLQWWEQPPKQMKEKRLGFEERSSRARAWYANHSTIGAISCSQAWPPMDLDLPVDWD